MKSSLALLGGLACFLHASFSWGQGLLLVVNEPVPLPRVIYPPHPRPIPHPTPVISYKIKELSIQARLADQVAKVQVSQTFVNNGSAPMEVQFLFPLPYDGAIDSMTLLVDGKEFPAKLLPAHEARNFYETIVRSRKDPALLEWIGSGMFRTNVFPVPPGAERKITLSYHQMLRKFQGLTDFLFPLRTAKYSSHPVERIDIQLHLESDLEIKNVYSPTHAVDIRRPDPRRALVTYSRANDIPAADFRLFFDGDPQEVGARLLSYRPKESEDGYFLLLASPRVSSPDAERPSKTVVFVLDRSGSMSGKKIEQARGALKFVLQNLREGDLFNIVVYDTAVESFRPELERLTEETRRAALGFVESIHAGGGTNIHGALTAALAQLKDTHRPSYVLFLTDGLPTVGETNEARIALAAKTANAVRARLLNFGVGYDVNSRLLDRLSRENFGQTEYVRPDEDIEVHVGRVFNRIGTPVLTDVSVTFALDGLKPEEGWPVNRLYPKSAFDLFEGEQLVLVGRYRKSGPARVRIQGLVAGKEQQHEFPAHFAEKTFDDSFAFIEKLWAMRRIGEIIDELDLGGRNEELVKELVALSTRHGILTPYTSFLAEETTRPLPSAENLMRAQQKLSQLESASGVAGVAQRAAKGALQFARSAAPGNATFRDIDSDREVVSENVRQFTSGTLYLRSHVVEQGGAPDSPRKIVVTPETAHLDPVKDQHIIESVERFSDRYFELVRNNSSIENQIFALQRPDEALLIRLRGKNYLVR